MSVRVLVGDCRERLREIDAGSIQTCVTSPPYWGLRDYGCDGQIGLEKAPDEYVAQLVSVFREVRRVLKDDGTLWLNLGDSYAMSTKGSSGKGEKQISNGGTQLADRSWRIPSGLKPKDLVGIPWLVAFALRADGWVLRSEIVWSKLNPMPESVTDRPTKAHEQLFLLSKARWVGDEPGRYSHISNNDAAWLALLFDTEGSLILRRESPRDGDDGAHSAQISVGNTSRALLDRAAAIVGAGSVLSRPGGKNAQMYHWQLSGKMARDLLLRIYPFFTVKQRQARVLIHLESRKEIRGGHARLSSDERATRDALWAATKSLNHFGDPDISWVPEPRFGHWDSQPYYYDAKAIAEPEVSTGPRVDRDELNAKELGRHDAGVWHGRCGQRGDGNRNKRTVWTIASEPCAEAHFAVMPSALVVPCILAGSRIGDTVLDPFGGSGTTARVAEELGRNAVLCELNAEYAKIIERRTAQAGLFAKAAP